MPTDFSILIVEDDDDARCNLEDILAIDEYEIQSVSHCLPAIETIKATPFDAVIVDWRLPDGDGGELIPLIANEQPNTPVIVVTGVRDFETPVDALRAGAYDFLTKPINVDVLRAVLGRLVERKQHLVEIETAQEKLLSSERLAAIGQMVAGLAHESRNAFQRSHACLAELTLDLEDMPDSLKLVHKIQKALDDINRLLEEVREYAAPIKLKCQECDIVEVINETWQQILEAKQVEVLPEFQTSSSENFSASCRIDRDRIAQVFRNLLENALFACAEPGQIRVDLQLGSNNQDKLHIVISDDGAGVPIGDREQIFTPFFTTKTKGTGLGLAICRRIIASHNGRLYVTDSRLSGASFAIELLKSCC